MFFCKLRYNKANMVKVVQLVEKSPVIKERDIFEHIRQAESLERTSVKDMMEHAQMAYQLSQKGGYQRLMLHSLYLVGKAHMRSGNMEEANQALFESFKQVKNTGFVSGSRNPQHIGNLTCVHALL